MARSSQLVQATGHLIPFPGTSAGRVNRSGSWGLLYSETREFRTKPLLGAGDEQIGSTETPSNLRTGGMAMEDGPMALSVELAAAFYGWRRAIAARSMWSMVSSTSFPKPGVGHPKSCETLVAGPTIDL